jgi:hypothetical protein
MTISNVSGASSFAQSGVGLDAEGQFALLVLEAQDSQHAAAAADKTLARDRFIEASADEVTAMREESKDIFIGACVQGATSAAAAAVQFGDAAWEPKPDKNGKTPKEGPWCEITAGALNAAAQPLGKMLGDSPAADDRADAKQAGSLAQQANWQLDDANDALHKSEQRTDKALDWLASQTANQASAETGIIAGFA